MLRASGSDKWKCCTGCIRFAIAEDVPVTCVAIEAHSGPVAEVELSGRSTFAHQPLSPWTCPRLILVFSILPDKLVVDPADLCGPLRRCSRPAGDRNGRSGSSRLPRLCCDILRLILIGRSGRADLPGRRWPVIGKAVGPLVAVLAILYRGSSVSLEGYSHPGVTRRGVGDPLPEESEWL